MWKNIVDPKHKKKYVACTLLAGYLNLQTHTQNMYYCFSTATVVA
jgi:hypothetical protein